MMILAETKDIVANIFNGSIAVLLCLAMPIIITLGYRYNQDMDKKLKASQEPQEAEAAEEPEKEQ